MKKNLLIISSLFLAAAVNAQSWTTQATGFAAASRGIHAVSVVDASTVWVATYDGSGAQGHVQDYSRTLDGGNTWTPGTVPVASPADYSFSNLWAIDANTAWALFFDATAGAGGALYKTTDGGANWAQQGAGTIFNATSFPDIVYFWDANKGFTLGDPNGGFYEIYTTTDGGTTWTRVPTANIPAPKDAMEYGIINLYEVMGNTIWFGTNEGRVYKSTDAGLHWTVSAAMGGAGDALSDIAFFDAQNGLATTYNTTSTTYSHFKTIDGGATWSPLTVTSGTLFNSDLAHVPGTNVIVSTGADMVATGSSYTMDGGATWVQIDTGMQHTAQGWADNMTGWAGGFNTDNVTGGIFKYTGVGLGVPALNRDNSRMRLYPNPSSGQFTLQIGGAETKDAQVSIVDLVGSVVYEGTIRNSSSVFKKDFDLTGVAKGIYVVNVVNGSTRFSNMITIK